MALYINVIVKIYVYASELVSEFLAFLHTKSAISFNILSVQMRCFGHYFGIFTY